MTKTASEVTLGLRSIDIKNFESHTLDSEWSLQAFKLNVGRNITVNPPSGYIRVALLVEMIHEESDRTICSLEVHVYFKITTFNENFVSTDNQISIPDAFLRGLINISYSTIRGIWHVKNIGMPAGQYILQIVDPSTLLVPFEIDMDVWDIEA